MESAKLFLKKYWWVILLIIVLYYLYTKQTGANCKTITAAEWKKKKQAFYDSNGHKWDMAQAQMLDAGYCEQFT